MRTVEQILQEYIGQQVLNLAKMTAEIEHLRAVASEVETLKADKVQIAKRILELEQVIDRMTRA